MISNTGRVLLGVILWLGVGYSQVDTATITGTVTDPTGASVLAAKIQATNQANGTVYHAASGDAGVYVLTALPIGVYDLEAGGAGFQTIRRRGITLSAGTRAKMDVQLALGQVSEVIDVS
ncbi:MAG TPA: carboxypeptidase-like regulatory domain-containing protein, partial [Bryobacteraceae bacterium]|nr:carboxypeptidase-like regulatory domain-containing protein [Bryobacteraceae bacterium]